MPGKLSQETLARVARLVEEQVAANGAVAISVGRDGPCGCQILVFSCGPRSEIERSGRGQAEGLDGAVRAAVDVVESMSPVRVQQARIRRIEEIRERIRREPCRGGICEEDDGVAIYCDHHDPERVEAEAERELEGR